MIKKKIELSEKNSVGFGVMVKCCGKMQQINYHQMNYNEWWECVDCKKPLVLVTETGWYSIGNKIVI